MNKQLLFLSSVLVSSVTGFSLLQASSADKPPKLTRAHGFEEVTPSEAPVDAESSDDDSPRKLVAPPSSPAVSAANGMLVPSLTRHSTGELKADELNVMPTSLAAAGVESNRVPSPLTGIEFDESATIETFPASGAPESSKAAAAKFLSSSEKIKENIDRIQSATTEGDVQGALGDIVEQIADVYNPSQNNKKEVAALFDALTVFQDSSGLSPEFSKWLGSKIERAKNKISLS